MRLVPHAASRTVARQVLLGQKHSPTILFASGVVGMIGSTVLACRATLRMEEVLKTTKNDLQTARSLEHFKYSEKDRTRDVAVVYARGTVKVTKLYAPAILLGAASITALTKSHNILNQRNIALTAAYAAVDESFRTYRQRVIDKYGEEQDREFRFATEEVEVLDESGKLTPARQVVNDGTPSMYARFFDQLSTSWSKEPEYNLVFLQCQQSYANNMLKSRGHVFLNEVYDMLGLERTKPGSVVGWIMSEDSDNYIDFGVFRGDGRSRDFVNGREGSILLDFNVDGVIFDKIDGHKAGEISWQK